ncbi:MAG: hypothetical protein QM278_08890 [Pseudomonadota bacterium]|nr:hypothetical protein [Pseudomonadota bacterium]
MRKLWVILLSLGLIAAFAMPAAAVDVKFSGQYYAFGAYVDNPSLLDKNEAPGAASWGAVDASQANSATRDNRSLRGPYAWYAQRLRMNVEFQVVEGLQLVTRFDALEKHWGDQGWAGGTGETQTRTQTPLGSLDPNAVRRGAATPKTQENLEFERAYLDFNVPFGKFQVGYQQFLMWGTDFLNTPLSAGGIRYYFSQGPWMAVAAIEKRAEYVGLNANNIGIANDADKDVYDLGAIYKLKNGEVGLLYQYNRNSQSKWQQGNGYLTSLHGLFPYTKLTFGNFFVEAEGVYGWGDLRNFESTTTAPTVGGAPGAGQPLTNVGLSALGAFVHAKYDWKPAYFGAQFVYLSGDDMSNSDKVSGSITGALQANYGFNRALILWNSDYGDNLGQMCGNMAQNTANRRTGSLYTNFVFMDNVWFWQIYAGVKPTPKLDFKAALSLASADKKPKSDVGATGSVGYYGTVVREFDSDKYGTELDLTGTYKIYDNLSYMVGFGYLWTGDYFKGYDVNAKVKDNYLLTHRLTLNF